MTPRLSQQAAKAPASRGPQFMRAYFDYNATAPLRPVARQAMESCLALLSRAGNPSSAHWAGRSVRRAIEEARERLSAVLGAEPLEIVFTSGGTESNYMALSGHRSVPLVTSAIEHSSILRLAARMEGSGDREVRVLPVDAAGRVNAEQLADVLGEEACLVSLGLANNEVGTVQDAKALAEIVHRHKGILHLDAVQAAGKIDIRVDGLDADMLSLSGHKVGGPPGIGALYVRSGIGLCGSLLGGSQEGGLRAGTENVLGIVGFAAAIEEADSEKGVEEARLVRLRELLWREIVQVAPSAVRNSARTGVLANTLNVSFPGLEGDAVAAALDLEGVAVSTGSACAAGAFEPSHVLQAMGKTEKEVRGAVRFSLGIGTTESEVEWAGRALAKVLARMPAGEDEPDQRGIACPPIA